jgi:very-short-patch-repair endonuclease
LRDRLWLGDLVERYPRKPGVPAVRALIAEAQLGLGVVRSELEERFQALLLNAAVPRPETNAHIEGVEVDCAWPEHNLIVELDGHATHGGAQAFETDRARDRRLEAAGWRVVRITWRQLHDTPDEVEADLRSLLGRSARLTRG